MQGLNYTLKGSFYFGGKVGSITVDAAQTQHTPAAAHTFLSLVTLIHFDVIMSYLKHWIAVLLLPLPLAKSVKITKEVWSVSVRKYDLLFEPAATCADKETSGLLYVSFN